MLNSVVYRFKNDRDISSPLAFAFLMVLSFVVAYLIISKAQEITEDAKYSPAFNIELRAGKIQNH